MSGIRCLKIMFMLVLLIGSGAAIAGTRVAIINPADNDSSTAQITASQLTDSTEFDFQVEIISPAQASDLSILEEFNAVILGESHESSTNYTLEMFTAMKAYLEGGGGLVATGYTGFAINSLAGAPKEIGLQLVPFNGNYQLPLMGVTIQDSEHPILQGITTAGLDTIVDIFEGVDSVHADTNVLVTIGDNETFIGVATRTIESGKTVYLGPSYHTLHGPYPQLREGDADRLLEQSIAWVSGAIVESHACATQSGQLKCWGANSAGQLGLSDTENRGDHEDEISVLSALDMGTDFFVQQVATGNRFTCALANMGDVACFGLNESGQLGIGSTENIGDEPGEMGNALQKVDLGGRQATQITAGFAHTCALVDDGNIFCWGHNVDGQLGIGNAENIGDQSEDSITSVDLGTDRTALQVVAGAGHNCALLDDQTVKCWGIGKKGQLGNGGSETLGTSPSHMGDFLQPVDLGGDFIPIKLFAGAEHTCAMNENHQLKCWGSNQYGQLGLGDTNNRGSASSEMGDALPLVDIGVGIRPQAFSCGSNHCCAITMQNTMKCWGQNRSGELGLGDTENRGDQTAEMSDELPFLSHRALDIVSSISAFNDSTCATVNRGTICWGANRWGELGQGYTGNLGSDSNSLPANINPIDIW